MQKVASSSVSEGFVDTLEQAHLDSYSITISKDVHAKTQDLPPALQRAVQILCTTYEAIDLRIETTLGAAEADFISAMPEVRGHDSELRQLAKLLIADLKSTTDAKSTNPLLLRFAFQDEGDLTEQLLSGAKARLVVVPVESDISLHANVKGSRK